VAALAFAACAAAQLSIGVSAGFAGGVTSEGVEGFSDSKFKPSDAYGASLRYRFKNGVFAGVSAEQFRLGLKENGDALGSLTVQPALILVGYQSKPANGRGFAGHIEFGGGIGRTRFEKGPALIDLERQFPGAQLVVRTRNAGVGEFGGGLDYFISRYASLTSDFRLLFSNIGTDWAAEGYGYNVTIPQISKFFASNGQVQGGIRLWFW